MSTTYEFQSLVVLSSIRLARLSQAVLDITGDRVYTQEIMAAVEQHLEVDAYRWGNACPESGERITSTVDGTWKCPTHGYHSHMDPMELLIAFKPCEPSS